MRVFLAFLLLSQAALAGPGQFTHQGRLLDADGMPLEDEVTITFRLTMAETGGDVLWEEPLTVSLTNGFYSAILGADEDGNPIDIDVLSQAPVWLELQLDGEPAMFPRSPVHSVPYAAMATVAEEVAGGPVDAETVAVGGVPVINEAGEWVGPATSVSWSDIEGMPEDFADGVDDDTHSDSLAELATSCVDGDIPVWDAVVEAWACDFDQDTLAGIGCLDGQLIHWSGDSMGWICADDVDTLLTEEDVDSMVADNGYAMASEVFSGSFLDLVDVPAGLEDGDDNTQLSETDVDEMVSDNGYAMGTDVFSGSFGDLADVPVGLEDGDDDTLAGLPCSSGEAATFSADGSWDCTVLSTGATAISTSDDELLGGEYIDLVVGSDDFIAGAWVRDDEGYWRSVASTLAQTTGGCSICGDESDGVYDAGGSAEITMAGGTYNFTDFVVPSWQTITVTGSDPLMIRASQKIDIQGQILADGGDSTSRSGGSGVAGGFNGGSGGGRGSDGATGGGPGGGLGGAGTNSGNNGYAATYDVGGYLSHWWLMENPSAATMVGGSGGGGGGGFSWSSGGSACGGGGAGGGVVALFSRKVSLTGTVSAQGGAGRSRSECSHGGGGASGSGGAVLIRATTANITGTIDVSGSTSGLIRIDAQDLSIPADRTFWRGSLDGIPDYLEIYQPIAGTVRLQNNSGSTKAVRLVAIK